MGGVIRHPAGKNLNWQGEKHEFEAVDHDIVRGSPGAGFKRRRAGPGLSQQAGAIHHPGRRRQQSGRGDPYRRRPSRHSFGSSKIPVDLHKAFAPVGMVGEQPIAVGVNKDVKANSVAELVQLVNGTKDGMLFAATNRGGQAHLTGELMRDKGKINMSFVHSAGAAVSINDVIAGRIPIMFEGLAGMAPGTQGGGIRLLGVASQKRLPNVPDLPAINETIPGVVSSGWIVMMVPAGVPDAIVQKLNKDLRTVTADKEVIERFQQLGTYSRDLSPEQTDDFIKNEEKLWWPIVRQVEAEDLKPAR
jgi:tripartite-type tricarboxylate transporter receptor subunit TctC